jgi:hypothetical protein
MRDYVRDELGRFADVPGVGNDAINSATTPGGSRTSVPSSQTDDGFRGSNSLSGGTPVPSSDRALGGRGNGGTAEFKAARAAKYASIPVLQDDPEADARIRAQAAARKAKDEARSAASVEGLKKRAEVENAAINNRAKISRSYGNGRDYNGYLG